MKPVTRSRDEKPKPWTQHELDLLHEMVRNYDRWKWFKQQVGWWVAWVIGLPATVLLVWEPIVRLLKLLRGVP